MTKVSYGTPSSRYYVARSHQVSLADRLLGLLSSADESSGFLSSSRSIISQALGNGLFAKLRLERTVTICETLLDVSSRDAETVCAKKIAVSIASNILFFSMLPPNKC